MFGYFLSITTLWGDNNGEEIHICYSSHVSVVIMACSDKQAETEETYSQLSNALLKDEDSRVRENAAEALGEIGYAMVIGALTAALNDENSRVRRQAEEALKKIQPE